MALNQSGQAAVTDALYFLLIVTGICVLLFSFANSYGTQVSNEVTSNYNTTFATDALKTILYSSTPRDPSKSLYDSANEIEVDHLLAFIKEDYSDDGSLSRTTKEVLAKDIMGILSPVSSNFDYAFHISIPSEKDAKYVYFFIKDTDSFCGNNPPDTECTNPNYGKAFYFFCGENESAAIDSGERFSGKENLEKEINKLLVSVGNTSAVSSRLKLSRVDLSGSINTGSNAQVDLVIWAATCLEPDKESNGSCIKKEFVNETTVPRVWNCSEFDPTAISS